MNRTDMPIRIGYLSGQHVLCMDCVPAAPRDMVPVYNVGFSYTCQSCHQCDRIIHTGLHATNWPELWDRKDCRQCQS